MRRIVPFLQRGVHLRSMIEYGKLRQSYWTSYVLSYFTLPRDFERLHWAREITYKSHDQPVQGTAKLAIASAAEAAGAAEGLAGWLKRLLSV